MQVTHCLLLGIGERVQVKRAEATSEGQRPTSDYSAVEERSNRLAFRVICDIAINLHVLVVPNFHAYYDLLSDLL